MFNSTLIGSETSPMNGNGTINADKINEEDESQNKFSKLVKYCFLSCSFLVVISKIYYSNKDYIANKIFTKKLVQLEWIENGLPYFTYNWKTSSFGEPYLIPLLFGIAVTLFTWGMVYLDSRTPGVNPPSPFAKSKIRNQSRSDPVHVGYLMPFLSGIVTFGVMLYMDT